MLSCLGPLWASSCLRASGHQDLTWGNLGGFVAQAGVSVVAAYDC